MAHTQITPPLEDFKYPAYISSVKQYLDSNPMQLKPISTLSKIALTEILGHWKLSKTREAGNKAAHESSVDKIEAAVLHKELDDDPVNKALLLQIFYFTFDRPARVPVQQVE